MNSKLYFNKFKKTKFNLSLSHEYFLFTAIILCLVFTLSALFFLYSYNLYIKQKQHHALKIAKTISSKITDIFEENENVLKFFGHKIVDKIEPHDLKSIADLLISTVDLNIKKMTKSYISWVNANGELTVSGKEGILKEKFPNIRNRKYFTTARIHPWSIQISDPTKSIFSNSNILPTGIGLTNQKGDFIGYLVLGLRIDYINKYISKIISSQKANYIILNNECRIILSSKETENLAWIFNNKKLANLIKRVDTDKPLAANFRSEQARYSNLIKIPNYPLSILVGFDVNYYRQEFLYKFILRLGELIFIGIFSLILLYFFRKRIILPIIKLSNVAFAISNGQLNVQIPKQNSIEMSKLAKGLLQVAKFIKKTEKYKKKLELANNIAKDSDFAKSEFMKKMNYEFGTYLRKIYIYSSFIYKNISNNLLEKQKIIRASSKIQEIVMLIYNKTSNDLEFKVFNLLDALEQSVKVNMKFSFLKEIIVYKNSTQDIFDIYADELRIKQVLISLIYQSIENSPKNSVVKINISSYIEKNITWFSITIQDQSFGLNENDLNEIEEKFSREDPIIFEFTKMKMKYIEEIVAMHKGKVVVTNKLHEGREVQLLLPLLTKEHHVPKKKVIHITDQI